jgi:6-phosphogluconolactonase (cycloisomerase 2 family)
VRRRAAEVSAFHELSISRQYRSVRQNLLAVGQLSTNLSAYRIDGKTGKLAAIGQYPAVPKKLS